MPVCAEKMDRRVEFVELPLTTPNTCCTPQALPFIAVHLVLLSSLALERKNDPPQRHEVGSPYNSRHTKGRRRGDEKTTSELSNPLWLPDSRIPLSGSTLPRKEGRLARALALLLMHS